MATTFPTSLQSLENKTDGVDYPSASDINDLNDTVEALESKVGIDDSAVSTSLDYIIQNKIWPIGSVFTAVVATSPATLLGFGTWSRIAQGKVLVGQNDSDADFNSAEETGGAKTANIAHTHTGPSHTHLVNGNTGTPDITGVMAGGAEGVALAGHAHAVSIVSASAGTGNTSSALSATQSIMNPYFVCYFWKRTA